MNNILKLKGFGLWVTYVDGKVHTSEMNVAGIPKLDPDGCIDWEELKDPPNQEFLNEINRYWALKLKMSDFGKPMSVNECLWYVKNLKEIYK
jgi:hypothetical protein